MGLVRRIQLAKGQLTSAKVLTHYDHALPINMAADVSAYGVGAVISHVFPDGSQHPIPLCTTWKGGTVIGICCEEIPSIPVWHWQGNFGHIPSLAAAQVQRWAIFLSAYQYDIKHKSTTTHSNADGLSRLPLPMKDILPRKQEDGNFNISQVQALPVTFQQIQRVTYHDKLLEWLAISSRRRNEAI